MSRVRVGLIGFGAIGQQVTAGIEAGSAGDAELVAILTRNPCSVAGFEMLTNFDDFLAIGPSLVVEAASAAAVTSHAESIVSSGASLILASASALVDSAFRRQLEAACASSGARIYVPAGAIAGLDALGAAAAGGLEEATLHVTEPRAGCAGRRVVFQGSALEGARLFPSRLNIAATAALTMNRDLDVELVEDADYRPRMIELRARGAFGEFSARMQPEPKPDRLSHIVALSLLATLRRIQQPIQIG